MMQLFPHCREKGYRGCRRCVASAFADGIRGRQQVRKVDESAVHAMCEPAKQP